MIRSILLYGLLILTFCAYGQVTTLVQEDFTIRDFELDDDVLIYLKKRDIHFIYDDHKEHYFIGGYGVSFFKLGNTIISAANELVRSVASVRFYNSVKKEVEDVYFYKQGRILDMVVMPDIEAFALSLSNKKIIVVNYSEKPRYYKIAEIELEALSRKIIYQNNAILFATDQGQIIKYSFVTNASDVVYSAKQAITDFIAIGNGEFIISTLDGRLIKATNQSEISSTALDNNFITTMRLSNNGNIVAGTWKGRILVFESTDLNQLNSLEVHKKTVLRLKQINAEWFSSSGLDGTIKKWEISKE